MMNDIGSLADVIEAKQELAERQEELTRKAIEDYINGKLKNYFERVPNDEILDALRDSRDLYICLRMPLFENRNTRIGKMFMESVNKILRQQYEKNLEFFLEIETDKHVINSVIRSWKYKKCVGNAMNTVIIHIIGREATRQRENVQFV